MPEIAAVNAEKAQRWDELRARLVVPYGGNPGFLHEHNCHLCEGWWVYGEPELHAPDCPLRPLEVKDA